MLNFSMAVEAVEGGLVWALRGDLDIETVRLARGELDDIEAQRPALLVIDLSALSFMDSTGLGLIAAAHTLAVEQQRRCVIVRPRGLVDTAFSLTGLGEAFETVRSLDEL